MRQTVGDGNIVDVVDACVNVVVPIHLFRRRGKTGNWKSESKNRELKL